MKSSKSKSVASEVARTAENSIFKRFRDLIEEGTKKLHDACQVYVDAIDNDPTMQERWQEKFPDVTPQTWRRFENVGRGAMDARLLTVAGLGAKRIEQLPYSEQKKVLDNPYVEIVPNESSDPVKDKIKANVFNLNQKQVKQVFESNHIRTPVEQSAFLKRTKKAETKQTAKTMKDFDIVKRGSKVYIRVNKPCEISFDEIMREVYAG